MLLNNQGVKEEIKEGIERNSRQMKMARHYTKTCSMQHKPFQETHISGWTPALRKREISSKRSNFTPQATSEKKTSLKLAEERNNEDDSRNKWKRGFTQRNEGDKKVRKWINSSTSE